MKGRWELGPFDHLAPLIRPHVAVALAVVAFAALGLACDSGGSGSVTIHRDAWGVPHVYGPTDASVVFGGAYAQAEDNWPQVEENFARAIGRGAELDGEDALLDDYLARGLEIPRRSIEEYERAPEELRRLYDAFAAGFNHYLDTHPEAERRVLDRVEPWYTLALIRFKYHHNEYLGYAGLEREQSLRALERAVADAGGDRVAATTRAPRDLPSRAWPAGMESPDGERVFGSNEWAVAGSRTRSGYPMLLINPHVSFFGISTYTEIHLASAEGLEFSGLTRFGFLLPYMGNNAHLGWAYTDNYGDHGDLYLIDVDDDGRSYRFGDGRRGVTTWIDTIRVETGAGPEPRAFRFSKTHHGPILGYTSDGRALAVRLAKLDEGGWFEQWYGMMRADSFDEWRAAAARLNVSYMNTMYADRDGNIVYVYNHAIPRRSTAFDWSLPVEGSDPATEWDGFHAFDELPQVRNPGSGYLQNTNSTPFTVTEGVRLDPAAYPPYMIGNETDNRRARNSRRILAGSTDLTLEEFADAALDTRLIAAEEWLPDLFSAYERAERERPGDVTSLAGPISALRDWNREADTSSVATTLFVAWTAAARPDREPVDQWLDALGDVVDRLEADWGTWEVAWGEINRLQRPDAAGRLPFSDTLPSLPVAGAPGWFGSIFTFYTGPAKGTPRRYGRAGNSFVKVVEFTPEVRARSVFVFGQSGDPASPHYFDQARLYSEKRFKPAWFQEADVDANVARTYALDMPARIGNADAPGEAPELDLVESDGCVDVFVFKTNAARSEFLTVEADVARLGLERGLERTYDLGRAPAGLAVAVEVFADTPAWPGYCSDIVVEERPVARWTAVDGQVTVALRDAEGDAAYETPKPIYRAVVVLNDLILRDEAGRRVTVEGPIEIAADVGWLPG